TATVRTKRPARGRCFGPVPFDARGGMITGCNSLVRPPVPWAGHCATENPPFLILAPGLRSCHGETVRLLANPAVSAAQAVHRLHPGGPTSPAQPTASVSLCQDHTGCLKNSHARGLAPRSLQRAIVLNFLCSKGLSQECR